MAKKKSPEKRPPIEEQPEEIPKHQESASQESADGFYPEKWYELMNERADLLGRLAAKGESWPPDPLEVAFKRSDAAGRIKRQLLKIDQRLKEINIKPSDHGRLAEFYQAADTDEKFSAMFELLAQQKHRRDNLLAEAYAIIQESKNERQGMTKADREALQENREDQQKLNSENQLLESSPETALYYRMATLEIYRQAMQSKNFVETHSRQKLAERIKFHLENGEPILLEGETGTGKTELALNLCRQLYGKEPEFLAGSPDVRVSDLMVKQGLQASETSDQKKREELAKEIREHVAQYQAEHPDAEEVDIARENNNYAMIVAASAGVTPETYFVYGPLVRAMEEGLPLVIDEANLIEPRLRMILKRIYNIKPGDEMPLAGDGKIKVAAGFGLIFTANLKGEKHTERFDFDEAEKRVMINSTIHIDYLPQEELYDLLLAKAMDSQGEAPMSRVEAESTLKNLCDAVAAIQTAYQDKPSEVYAPKDTRGRQQEFKEGVLDPGAALRMLNGLEAKDPGESLTDFLNRSIISYASNRNYNPKDRELIAKILMSKGFLQSTAAKELKIPGLAEETLKPFKAQGVKTAQANGSNQPKKLNRGQLAELDPYGQRKLANAKIGEGFLSLAGEGEGPEDQEREIKDYLPTIQTQHYIIADGNEREINLEINFEEKLVQAKKFYEDHNIELPVDFETRVKEIWARNYEAIKKEMATYGYDHILIIPESLPDLAELNAKMTDGYEATFQGDNFKNGGSFSGVHNSKSKDNNFRLVLVHQAEAQNLDDQPLLKATKGKSPELLTGKTKAEIEAIIASQGDLPIKIALADIAFGDGANPTNSTLQAEGLTLADYLIFQRQYFEATQKHLDEQGWTWLLSSFSARLFVSAAWAPDDRQLAVYANAAGYSSGRLGCRPSRSFR